MKNKLLLKAGKLLGCFFLLPFFITAQTANSVTTPPALASIKVTDLKRDLYALADAHYNGRSAGTLDELKASMWIADQYRNIGLLPGGDDGTYFQFFDMWRNQVAAKSSVSINGRALNLWNDVAIAQMANVNLEGNVFFLNNMADTMNVKDKIVAMEVPAGIFNAKVSLPSWRYGRNLMNAVGNSLVRKGATAVIFIADAITESVWADATENFKRGNYDIEGGPNVTLNSTVPVLWVHPDAKAILATGRALLKANIIIEQFQYPSVNIIGTIPGSDKTMAKEYVFYSGHQDAHGIRNPINKDSIYYGADDNGSVDVAMFAIARAFKKNPGRRSVIFVIHGAEERGLLGSRYYTTHPTIPLQNIVAVLNGDMIGRNHPDSAAVLGVQPPHRTSKDLVNMALDANKEGPDFKLDTLWDKVSHPEGWYFRSDHLPYAKLGIPSLMYTTLLHPDYHTPGDNAGNINYNKLKKMTDWMYRTGWKVANANQRPAKDEDFKLER